MELDKKTTILFSEDQFKQLKHIAAIKKTSIGHLIRRACEHEYGIVSKSEMKQAVDQLSHLSLPVGAVKDIKKEIVHGKPD